jgi:hypothetical protein
MTNRRRDATKTEKTAIPGHGFLLISGLPHKKYAHRIFPKTAGFLGWKAISIASSAALTLLILFCHIRLITLG